MVKKQILAALVLMILSTTSSYAASGDDILGVWNNQEKDARIEIQRCGDKYCGRIVWLKVPNYPEGSSEGVPGTPKVDHNNPDKDLREAPVMGLQIVHDFSYAGENKWSHGRVYDPKNGRTYSGKLTLVSPAQLNLRGFIGISLLGRTAVWTR
jgi:uncharacterized protein (DUF2147 family)